LRSLACALVKKGTKPEAICEAIAECVQCSEDESCKRAKQAQAQAASAALDQSNTTLLIAEGALNVFELAARVVGRVARFVPMARPAAVLLSQVEGQLGTIRATLRAARAANDSTLRVLRLAA
jgi:hypothetical protein